MSDNDRREGAALTTFRTAGDYERAVILARKIEHVQLAVRSTANMLAQVTRQVDELMEYRQVLEDSVVADPEAWAKRKIIRNAILRQYKKTNDEGRRAKLLELAVRFGAEPGSWL